MQNGMIRIRGARQNNLKGIDVDIPTNSLVVLVGLSGSGKSSLAFDTLYAEGQRRYVESFSTYARQFLDRMDRPHVDSIEGILPAIAIDQTSRIRTSRSTVGTVTEIADYLKLLFARASEPFCTGCGRKVARDTPETVLQTLRETLPAGEKVIVTFPYEPAAGNDSDKIRRVLTHLGFNRVLEEGGRIVDITESESRLTPGTLDVVVDRLAIGGTAASRVLDSLEQAFRFGNGLASVHPVRAGGPAACKFSRGLHCPYCDREYPEPTAGMFSFTNPVGACDVCRGFGRTIELDLNLVIPDRSKSIDEGAVKPWTTGLAREAFLDLRRFCRRHGIPTDIPFRDLKKADQEAVIEGTPDFYGIRGFFNWLDTRTYKMHVRVYLSRYRGYKTCWKCGGTRLKEVSLAYRVGGRNIGEIFSFSVNEAFEFFGALRRRRAGKAVEILVAELYTRLSYLRDVGLGYLTLDRQSRTLSGGEVERVNLTRALGSSLVNTLYILDEPSIGLHPRDNLQLIGILNRLKKSGNTVLVVEHEPQVMKQSDLILELGPRQGEAGGRLVFSGTYAEILKSRESLTGSYLAGRRKIPTPGRRRKPTEGLAVRIEGARANNLKGISLSIPLGLFVCVTGVSGSGKSTLVEDILLPGYKRHRGEPVPEAMACDRITGFENVTELVLVDQSPVGKTPRANPVTYTKAFDAIRHLFASVPEATDRGYTAGTFSFNTPGGRCETCRGEGFEKIEMQFLSDVFIPCPDCAGKRYGEEVLEIRFNGRNIDDVLRMTVAEAGEFFRDHPQVLEKLAPLSRVGLGYLRLGQGVHTLSGGEAQRLKLARAVSDAGGGGRLFIFDEPTTGLHFEDVGNLIEVFQQIVEAGNTVLVIEHNLDMIRQADRIIDLGPEGGNEGGDMVAFGTPEEVARVEKSHTGLFLRQIFDEERRPPLAAERVPPYGPPAGNDGFIRVKGAREHNLKNLSLDIPRQKLVVISGLSGSGKSTLAFDILFSEGQRRYLESLPSYARQFLPVLQRPDIDRVSGLPPTVAVEQRLAGGGARSTVATITEIYHYLRLLYAKAGTPHCPDCGLAIAPSSEAEILRVIRKEFGGKTASLLAPVIIDRKGHYRELFERLVKKGVAQVRVDGRYGAPGEFGRLARYEGHDIDIEIYRGEVSGKGGIDLKRALKACLAEGKGLARVRAGKKERLFNLRSSCPRCGLSYEQGDPRLFSFNSRKGWCESCEGLGFLEQFSPGLIVPDPEKSIEAGALDVLSGPLGARTREKIADELQERFGLGVKKSFRTLPKQVQREILFGNGDFSGIIPRLERLFEGTQREALLEHLAAYRAEVPCPDCGGGRLKRERLSVRFRGESIAAIAERTVGQALAFFSEVRLAGREGAIARDIVEEIRNRLQALDALGLRYLALDRRADTLSGGEAQRIRIAAQLGSQLRGILYILDEPTIGLHPADGKKLIETLRTLQGMGATVIVVEHDEAMIRSADHIIDLGPGAGPAGGKLVAAGSVEAIRKNPDSITGRCLKKHPAAVAVDEAALRKNGKVRILGASEFNLKHIDVEVPLSTLTCVTGVSGAGKSTLVKEILYKGLKKKLRQAAGRPGRHKDILGWEGIQRVAEVDQSPIGRTPRSVPASYIGFLDDIRKLFSMLPEARARGYKPGRFSFNVRGGRCERCEGQGRIKVEMSFLPDVYVECEACGGRRFNDETLSVRFKGKSIADFLNMTALEVMPYMEGFPSIHRFLQIMRDTGLGYLALGQPSHTLSGGEAQRVKLAEELGRPGSGRTLYILDEPTTGLHMADIANLVRVFRMLVERGHTIVVIEHNMDVISQADCIIDLGPGGGDDGGRVVAWGPPQAIIQNRRAIKKSRTAEYLKKYLEG